MNVIFISFIVLFIIIFLGCVIYFYKSYYKYKHESEISENNFENEIISQFNKINVKNNPDMISKSFSDSADDQKLQSDFQNTIFDSKPAPVENQLLEIEKNLNPGIINQTKSPEINIRKSIDDLIIKLQSANIVRNIEGPVPNISKENMVTIVHFKSGKRAIIIPYYESENFVINNLPKTDMIFMILKNGDPVIINKLGQFIADSF